LGCEQEDLIQREDAVALAREKKRKRSSRGRKKESRPPTFPEFSHRFQKKRDKSPDAFLGEGSVLGMAGVEGARNPIQGERKKEGDLPTVENPERARIIPLCEKGSGTNPPPEKGEGELLLGRRGV